MKRQKNKQTNKKTPHKHFCHPSPCVGKHRAWLTKTDNHRKGRQGESKDRNDNIFSYTVPIVNLAMQLALNIKL